MRWRLKRKKYDTHFFVFLHSLFTPAMTLNAQAFISQLNRLTISDQLDVSQFLSSVNSVYNDQWQGMHEKLLYACSGSILTLPTDNDIFMKQYRDSYIDNKHHDLVKKGMSLKKRGSMQDGKWQEAWCLNIVSFSRSSSIQHVYVDQYKTITDIKKILGIPDEDHRPLDCIYPIYVAEYDFVRIQPKDQDLIHLDVVEMHPVGLYYTVLTCKGSNSNPFLRMHGMEHQKITQYLKRNNATYFQTWNDVNHSTKVDTPCHLVSDALPPLLDVQFKAMEKFEIPNEVRFVDEQDLPDQWKMVSYDHVDDDADIELQEIETISTNDHKHPLHYDHWPILQHDFPSDEYTITLNQEQVEALKKL